MNLIYIIKLLEELYPEMDSDDWDNSGGQVINFDKDIKNIIVTLDISDKLIDYAFKNKADLIISHHPMIFGGLNKIDISTYKGKMIKRIMDNEINIYSMHTNFDMANLGMTKLIAKKLGYDYFEVLKTKDIDREIGYGGIIDLKEDLNRDELINLVKEKFEIENLNFFSSGNKIYKKLSFCGGSGGDFIKNAAKVSDIYITGDFKHHDYQLAYELGLDIIDVGHYNSEKFFIEYISDILKKKNNSLNVDIFDRNVFKSIIK
ncbi:MAG: Nif3-like dinuclear metal center hexameric protein [Bacillota bacterium]|nr:Nif3-like dinuclear metal center hexameric protein [Bacillota bacterium]